MALPDRANLAGEWLANNDATDSSGNSKDLTLYADTTYDTGKISQGFSFDGSNDCVYRATTTDFDYDRLDAFSYECWFKTSDALAVLMGKKGYQISNGAGTLLYLSSGNVRFSLRCTNSTVNYITSNTGSTYNDNTWHHVIATNNGDGNAAGMGIAIDGSFVATTTGADTANGTVAATPAFQCSGYHYTNNDHGAFAGMLDIIRVWNIELSSDEVSSLYNGGTGIENFDTTTSQIGQQANYYYG